MVWRAGAEGRGARHVKPLDPDHWNQRYIHEYNTVPDLDGVVADGASIINIHQGNDHNPYINYPFLTTERRAAYAAAAHEQDVKVKVYYTCRELSNFTREIFALRSLGHEVFIPSGGRAGDSWLREHLASDYAAAWHQPYANGEVDAAIVTQGLSRWHNYYLEGLGWLIRDVGIDGLYLDGIGYDREIMKRVLPVASRSTRSLCVSPDHTTPRIPSPGCLAPGWTQICPRPPVSYDDAQSAPQSFCTPDGAVVGPRWEHRNLQVRLSGPSVSSVNASRIDRFSPARS